MSGRLRLFMGIVTIAKLKENIRLLRKEIAELKACFHEDVLPISKKVRDEVAASRKRKDSELIKHTDVLKEFC